MSIAREFIRRGRALAAQQAGEEHHGYTAEFQADDWDAAIFSSCLDSLRTNDFRRLPFERLTQRQTDIIARFARDFLESGIRLLSPADYGRGTVALIVKHAERGA